MLLYDMQTVATHVLSQHLYRYFALPSYLQKNKSPPNYDALYNLGREDWLTFLEDQKSKPSDLLEWSELLEYFGSKDLAAFASRIHRFLAAVEASDAHYVLYHDATYPDHLRHLSDPPIGLTMYGDRGLFRRKCVAVIGSRKASWEALELSGALGSELAKNGYVVVSGGAYGCDIAAHRGSLNHLIVPAPVVVVMASGLAKLYPQGNALTFKHITETDGIILSERLWDDPCRPMDFPVRNRIVAGLVTHVVVVEAGERSGAMITARQALDQGRDVWVYSKLANRCDVRACGNALLIAEGAPTFETCDELVENLRVSFGENEIEKELPDLQKSCEAIW